MLTKKELGTRLDDIRQKYHDTTNFKDRMELNSEFDKLAIDLKSNLGEQFYLDKKVIVTSIIGAIGTIEELPIIARKYGEYLITIKSNAEGEFDVDIIFKQIPFNQRKPKINNPYIKILHQSKSKSKRLLEVVATLNTNETVKAKTHLKLFNQLSNTHYDHPAFVRKHGIATPNPLLNKTASMLFNDLNVKQYRIVYTNDDYDLIEFLKAKE